MTENERKINAWRNERRNHCQFATQRAYDDQKADLAKLKGSLIDKDISEDMAVAALVEWFHYGEQGARRVVSLWLK